MTLSGADIAQFALAAGIATIVTALELITTKYPRTAIFVTKSVWFYCYVVIYALLAAITLALIPLVSDQVTMDGVGLSNPWVKAAVVGFSIKAFLHIRIFTVSTGPGQSFPVGLETIVQLFEPWMLRSIELDHFSGLTAFIRPRTSNCPTVDAARQQALTNIPNTFTTAERSALTADITQASSPAQVIIAYLNYVGIKTVAVTFP